MYKIAIQRPITTLMFIIALVLFGVMGYKSMPASLFPKVDFPLITVTTTLLGADPKTMESKVSDKIEEVVTTIDGVEGVSSTSSYGISNVVVEFAMEKDINEAANDVRDKVNSIIFSHDVDKPLVRKFDAMGGAIINVFVSSATIALEDMMVYIDTVIKPQLQRVDGVGQVSLVGYMSREIKIYPDPFLLNKYAITVSELNSIIQRENVKKGGGRLISSDSEISIKTEGDAKSVEELKSIKIRDGIRLQDIARVEDSLKDARSYSSYNGNRGVMLEVKKISGENTVNISNSVKALVPKLQESAGDNYKIRYAGDTSGFVLRSLKATEFDLIYGSILATLIVFLFLRNFRATLVAALAIPTSIFGTFFIMSYLEYELNIMTLVGLALAIGIMIDDAIVVIENIYKKLEAGLSKKEAALEGVREIIFSILGISAMLLAVFIPVTFMSGIVGSFFESFAMTITFAIIVSFVVVTTLIPSISARILSKEESRFYHITEPFFASLDRFYALFLSVAIRNKAKTILVVIMIFLSSLYLAKFIGNGFKPNEDNSEMLVKLEAPNGTSLEKMTTISKEIASIVRENRYVQYTTLRVGYNSKKEVNKAIIYAKLLELEDRDKNQFVIIQDIRELFKDRDDVLIRVSENPTMNLGDVSAPFQFLLKSSSLDDLEKTSKELIKRLSQIDGIVDVDSTYSQGKPELKVVINRENAVKYGISASAISSILNTAFSSDRAVSKYTEYGKQYDITLRFSDSLRDSIEDIKRMQIKAPNGQIIYLDGLIDFEQTTTNGSISRKDRVRMVNVYASLNGMQLGEAVAHAEEIAKEIMPKGMSYELFGQAKEMKKVGKSFIMAVSMTLILMYIILAALYESLVQPIIIMITLPLSVTGVLLALAGTGSSFNLFVMIGIMLLLGMVGKNGVLIVDFANQEIDKGKSIDKAIVESGKKRLRPVLMTTFAMIFAMLPIALSHAAGSETKSPMAIAIIGGLISSTMLTLVVIPAFYRLLYPLDSWLRKWYEFKKV